MLLRKAVQLHLLKTFSSEELVIHHDQTEIEHDKQHKQLLPSHLHQQQWAAI